MNNPAPNIRRSHGKHFYALSDIRSFLNKVSTLVGATLFFFKSRTSSLKSHVENLDSQIFLSMGLTLLVLFFCVLFLKKAVERLSATIWVAFTSFALLYFCLELFYFSRQSDHNIRSTLFSVIPWLSAIIPYTFIVYSRRLARIAANLYCGILFLVTTIYALGLGNQQSPLTISVIVILISICFASVYFIHEFSWYRECAIEQSLQASRLGEHSLRDSQTNLANRHALRPQLEKTLQRLKSNSEQFGIILLEIDYFLKIVEDFGQVKADRSILSVAKLLSENTRLSDLCGRWENESFLLIVGLSAPEGLRKHAERLRFLIQNLRGSELCPITASLGVTLAQPDDTIDSLIGRATTALETAKTSGHNQYTMLLKIQ